MASARAFPFPFRPVPGVGESVPPMPDEDDGIHIASVTPVERPDGRALRVVVSWFEEGAWVETTVELPEAERAEVRRGSDQGSGAGCA